MFAYKGRFAEVKKILTASWNKWEDFRVFSYSPHNENPRSQGKVTRRKRRLINKKEQEKSKQKTKKPGARQGNKGASKNSDIFLGVPFTFEFWTTQTAVNICLGAWIAITFKHGNNIFKYNTKTWEQNLFRCRHVCRHVWFYRKNSLWSNIQKTNQNDYLSQHAN